MSPELFKFLAASLKQFMFAHLVTHKKRRQKIDIDTLFVIQSSLNYEQTQVICAFKGLEWDEIEAIKSKILQTWAKAFAPILQYNCSLSSSDFFIPRLQVGNIGLVKFANALNATPLLLHNDQKTVADEQQTREKLTQIAAQVPTERYAALAKAIQSGALNWGQIQAVWSLNEKNEISYHLIYSEQSSKSWYLADGKVTVLENNVNLSNYVGEKPWLQTPNTTLPATSDSSQGNKCVL